MFFVILAFTIAIVQLLGMFFTFLEKFSVLLTAATPFLLGYMAYLQKRQERHMTKQDAHLERQDKQADQIHKKVDGMTDKLVIAEKAVSFALGKEDQKQDDKKKDEKEEDGKE